MAISQQTKPGWADSVEAHSAPTETKPAALVVLLENVGHIHGISLPQWAMDFIDYLTEEYAKVLLRLYGAHRRYQRVVILEDEHANGPEFATTLIQQSLTHRVDVLLLVHGHTNQLVGHRGKEMIGPEVFGPLHRAKELTPKILDLRMVYGLNCHGITLAEMWIQLGAEVANGAVDVNWFPEPSLSVFLRTWLRGGSYSDAVCTSNNTANRIWNRLLPRPVDQPAHPWILSSRQVVFGRRNIDIAS